MTSFTIRLAQIAALSAVAMAAAPASAVTIIRTIDFAGATVVQARGINAQGQITGYRVVDGVQQSFISTGDSFQFFQVESAPTAATAINDSATTVGSVTLPTGASSFIRQPDGTALVFQPLGDTDSGAIGINNAGDVVASGNAFFTGGYLRRANGNTTPINYAGAPTDVVLKTNATDINNLGTIVGHAIGQSDGQFFGRGWLSTDSGATFSDLTKPGQQFTYLWGANDTGLLVGDHSQSFGAARIGFYYNTATAQFTDFTIPGADWTVPTGINDDGVMVGFTRNAASGRISGFVAVIPEPASLALLSLPALLLTRRQR
jgi:hypothetical protein